MTRKDYTLIAESFLATRPEDRSGLLVWRLVVSDMAVSLGRANAGLDKDKFLRAAGFFPSEAITGA